MLDALLLLAAAAADTLPKAPVHDGGVCVGLAWVTLLPDEQAFVERGPDFNVYRFSGPGGPDDRWWGVYMGNAASPDATGPRLLTQGPVTIRRALDDDGKFDGYLVRKGRWQNHFFGSVFRGDRSDRRFFARIDFGNRGRRLCAAKQGKPG